jgi:hypothetical protein
MRRHSSLETFSPDAVNVPSPVRHPADAPRRPARRGGHCRLRLRLLGVARCSLSLRPAPSCSTETDSRRSNTSSPPAQFCSAASRCAPTSSAASQLPAAVLPCLTVVVPAACRRTKRRVFPVPARTSATRTTACAPASARAGCHQHRRRRSHGRARARAHGQLALLPKPAGLLSRRAWPPCQALAPAGCRARRLQPVPRACRCQRERCDAFFGGDKRVLF